MKKTKRLLSLLMVIIMLFQLASISFAGFEDISKAVWDKLWLKNSDTVGAAVTMFPGSDENDRIIAWYSESKEGYVELNSLKGSEKINASVKQTPQGDNRLWAALENLEAGLYTYRCVSGDFRSDLYGFTVEENDCSTVAYITDIHISQDGADNELCSTAYSWNRVLNQAVKAAAIEGKIIDTIVSGGDQASEGLRSEYEGLSAPAIVKSIPLSVCVGNHDRKSTGYKYYTANPNEAEQTFRSYIGKDYWFRQGEALFLILDSCNVSMREHYKFMENATELNSDATWVIAVMHHDMYGGREPWLDTENTMLRLLWTPFFDKFGVDLCLYGHSHFYSVSNVIYGRKSVEKTGHNAELTDPQGTVYIASGSISRPADVLDDEGNTPPVGENAGYVRLEENETIFNLIDITEDTLTFKSYSAQEGDEFNRLTITKTSKQGGHSYKNSAWYLKPVAFFVGRIVNIINNIDMYNRYKQQGFDVSLKEGLIGS